MVVALEGDVRRKAIWSLVAGLLPPAWLRNRLLLTVMLLVVPSEFSQMPTTRSGSLDWALRTVLGPPPPAAVGLTKARTPSKSTLARSPGPWTVAPPRAAAVTVTLLMLGGTKMS